MKRINTNGALQMPVNSGFSLNSTSIEIISGFDLTGKVAIVTGGNTGIGLETVKTLALAGATVIVPARDVKKATSNLKGVRNVLIDHLDLGNPASIDLFAQKFLMKFKELHILVNNAGIMWVPFSKDARGLESQFAVNYLAQFHLTARLWPALKITENARVINVSSGGHHFSPFNFEDPYFKERNYETLVAYGQSKTAVNLFSLELDNYAIDFGVRAYSLNPGSIAGTELAREASKELFIQMGFYDKNGEILPDVAANLKTIPQGAATTLWCATSPKLENIGGVYCEDCNIAKLNSELGSTSGVNPYSLQKTNAERLWELSEKITGIKFPFN